jgi:glutathione peroxidase
LLKKQFGDRLVIVAFPCNQFSGQEPKSDAQIAAFTKTKGFDGVVNGSGASAVFDFLKVKSKTGGVMWNFYKFVVSPCGTEVTRFTTAATPLTMAKHIAETLRKWDERNND